MSANILFIGGGNMASSIIGGLRQNDWPAPGIMAADPDSDKLHVLAKQHGIKTTIDNTEFIPEADVIVLAVKPQLMKTVAGQISSLLNPGHLLISIAAGINIANLKSWLSPAMNIVRTMPNTPALVQEGISGMYADSGLTQDLRDLTENIMSSIGDTVWVSDEDLINSITAVSGSGPAYFFLWFEAMQRAAVELGLDEKTAKKLVTKTARGAAVLADSQGISFRKLKENVTSPGGTTEKALKVFVDADFKEIIEKAVKASYLRAVELAEQANK